MFLDVGELKINLKFPDFRLPKIDLSDQNCVFEIYDNGKKRKEKFLPILGHGGWECTLPISLESSGTPVRILLEEKNGEKWETGWFYPNVCAKEVKKLGGN